MTTAFFPVWPAHRPWAESLALALDDHRVDVKNGYFKHLFDRRLHVSLVGALLYLKHVFAAFLKQRALFCHDWPDQYVEETHAGLPASSTLWEILPGFEVGWPHNSSIVSTACFEMMMLRARVVSSGLSSRDAIVSVFGMFRTDLRRSSVGTAAVVTSDVTESSTLLE